MSKITQNVLTEDFYKTTLTSDVAASGDIILSVTTPPVNKKGFIIVDPENISTREKMYYHDVIGSDIYVKAENRVNAQAHSSTDKVQINDTSLIFNYLSKLGSTTFFNEIKGPLLVNVWGGPILRDGKVVSISDTEITVIDATINYIYYKASTNEIKSDVSETVAEAAGVVVAEVTASAGLISKTEYRNYKFSLLSNYDIISLPTYSITGSSELRGFDATSATIQEIRDVLGTLLMTDLVSGFKGPSGTITIGTVKTGAAGSSVIITNIGTSEDAVLDITIPQGDDGDKGEPGDKGEKGEIGDITSLPSTNLEIMLGGTGTKGYGYSVNPYRQLSVGTSNNVGSVAQPEVAQSFFGQTLSISTILLMIKKILSPTDDILIEIQTDNAGVPSGTVVTNGTSNVVNYATLTTSFVETTFTFAAAPSITKGDLYHIVVKRSGVDNAVNYYAAESGGSDLQIGTMSKNTGTWANVTDDLYFKITSYVLATLGGTNFIGILQETAVIGETKKFSNFYDANQSGLTTGNQYGFNASTGAIEAGTLFKAISATEMFLISITAASETAGGIMKIATQALMDAETDDETAVTPLKFSNNLKKIYTVGGDVTEMKMLGWSDIITGSLVSGETGDKFIDTGIPIADYKRAILNGGVSFYISATTTGSVAGTVTLMTDGEDGIAQTVNASTDKDYNYGESNNDDIVGVTSSTRPTLRNETGANIYTEIGLDKNSTNWRIFVYARSGVSGTNAYALNYLVNITFMKS